ncbi:MAG TPA: M2 family metallopeptidase [Thermoguttaceae bacterium]|nr:M2 family metallopeptidase [Thermoguttaceae bacterium]HPP53280.1 M2 family metallopeptidase [Thermoguttaceae bacterium]
MKTMARQGGIGMHWEVGAFLGVLLPTLAISSAAGSESQGVQNKAALPIAVQQAKESSVSEQAQAFLDRYESQLAQLEKKANLASWQAANTGRPEDFQASAEAALAVRRFHSDPAGWAEVQGLLKHRSELESALARSLELVELAYRANQLPEETLRRLVEASTEIERCLSTYRAKMNGREYSNNELQEMLREAKDSQKRQSTWEALKQVGGLVGPKLIALAHQRNQAAQQLGYKNFWYMQMHRQEHEPAELLALFDELDRLTREPFTNMKARLDAELAQRFGCPVDQLRPWHYDNPFFQSPPPSAKVDPDAFYRSKSKEEIVEMARRFFADVGLPVDDILQRSDLYERPGKDQHAFCTHIDRRGDVRTLCNVKPTAEWMGVVLHELGHGVYELGLGAELRYTLRQPAHAFTTEAVAMLFGAKALEPQFLLQYVQTPSDRVQAAAEALAEQRRREQLIFCRWTLVMFHFEKALYEDPDQDLNRLWWDLVERYQQLHRPEGRNQPDWASKPHFTVAPVYYHNYMLGELLAAQLRHAIAQQYSGPKMAKPPTSSSARAAEGPAPANPPTGGPMTSGLSTPLDARLGEFLRQRVFAPGALHRWPEFVRRATGEPLTARYFAHELAPP